MRRSGAEVVVQALEEEGVRFTFGIPGTHNIELYDALDRSEKVRAILVTDEQSASFMADGVARSTGTVGVANVVPGAGVTHALSGIAEAFMDGIPLVVLTCGIRTDTPHAFQLHDVDQLAVLRPITKAAWKADSAAKIYPLLRRAFALARAGTPGPVAVEIPANFYLLSHDFPPLQAPAPSAEPPLDEDAVAQAARLLSGAEHPAIYAGYGTRAATAALRGVAEALAAPVATTIQGKGVFPEDHPLFLWNGFGAAAPPFVRTVMKRCDCLLAVGCRFGEVATASYGVEPPANLIHVDINPTVFHRNFPAALAVEADAGAFLAALLARLSPRGRAASLEETIARGHAEVRGIWEKQASGERVTPAVLFRSLQGLAGEDAIYATDSGNGTFLAMEHLRLTAPGRFLAPVDYSCMGYAVPAAVGAKLANPERDVIALPGDGALLMTGLELLTAAAYGAGVVACVLRDGELAQIAQFQRTTLNNPACSVISPYSVEHFAAAAGCAYLRMRRDEEVRPVLEEALAAARLGRPAMVEVTIDYSRKTYFTKGVVSTNLWRLPWSERVRLITRAVGRRIVPPATRGKTPEA